MAETPVVYILHGDDEYAIAGFIASMETKMGDPSLAAMNTTRMEGSAYSLENLAATVCAMPFLAERRLVILADPLGGMKSTAVREKFTSILEKVPPSTALVLVIQHPLVSEQEKRRGVQHWLQKWASDQAGCAYEREFLLPRGEQMIRWIQTKAGELGGTFSHQAAAILAEYVQGEPRLAAQEIEKLLAYVNYQRPVEADDVQLLTPFTGEGDVFKMVDAIGSGDGSLALRMLHQLLEVDDPLRLLGMVVRQFRMLLLTRELLDAGSTESEIARQLKTYPFIARKLMGQVRSFSMVALENIYNSLLDVDEAIKTGRIPPEVALDTLVTSLTQ
jgi:DNA polymerase-3 subunit delta